MAVATKPNYDRVIKMLPGEKEIFLNTFITDAKAALHDLGSNGAQVASSSVTLMVSDQRIVVVNEDYAKCSMTVERKGENSCFGLFSLCWYPGGKGKKAIFIRKSLRQRCFQAADLKDVTFKVHESEVASAFLETLPGLFKSEDQDYMASKKPDTVIIQAEVEVTFYFAKQVGDFTPTWRWFSDMKSSHLAVTVRGFLRDPDDARSLRDAVLHHKELVKPSRSQIPGLTINPGPSRVPKEKRNVDKFMRFLGVNGQPKGDWKGAAPTKLNLAPTMGQIAKMSLEEKLEAVKMAETLVGRAEAAKLRAKFMLPPDPRDLAGLAVAAAGDVVQAVGKLSPQMAGQVGTMAGAVAGNMAGQLGTQYGGAAVGAMASQVASKVTTQVVNDMAAKGGPN